MMSVPRPAMLVAMVTAPFLPAWATISASRSWFLALSTLCGTPRPLSILDSVSLFSTLTVPTSTGWPFSWHSMTCSMTASYLPLTVLYTLSGRSLRARGLLVGTLTICRP